MNVPKQASRQLYGVYVRHRDRNRILLDELTRIATALESAQIDALVLKGPALIALLYDDPGLRPLSDLDLLVRDKDVVRAQQVTGDLGYTVCIPSSEFLRTRHHHLQPGVKTVEGVEVAVEIHRCLLSSDRTLPTPDGDTLPVSRRFILNGTTLRTLETHDLLWHLCRHLVGLWHPFRLVWAADIIGWVEQYVDEIDWSFIQSRRPFILNTLSQLHWLTPLPSKVIDLGLVPVMDAPPSVAVDYTGWPRATATQWDGWRGRWQFAKSTLSPPAWWLALTYGTGTGKIGKPKALAQHVLSLGRSVSRRARDFMPRRQHPPLGV